MVQYLLKDGFIVTPSGMQKGSLLIKGTKIADIFYKSENFSSGLHPEVMDCSNCYILPGIIDPHVHLRDFDQSYKETISTATQAAIQNGVTTVIGMPNTNPPLNSIGNIKNYIQKIKESSYCNVGLYARLPDTGISEYLRILPKLGIFGIKIYPGDSPNLLDWNLLRELWEDLKEKLDQYMADIEQFVHKLDTYMDHHYSKSQLRAYATKWGEVLAEIAYHQLQLLFHADVPLDAKIREIRFKTFEGIHKSELIAHSSNHSKAQELLHIYFVFAMLKMGSVQYLPAITFCHVSSIEAIHLIQYLRTKNHVQQIFIEITPHHTYLNDALHVSIPSYGKVLPPLRTEKDNIQIQSFLTERNEMNVFYGTDHAPHSREEKNQEFIKAPPGFPCLDVYTLFVLSKYLENGWNLSNFVYYASYNPAQIYQIKKKGHLYPGYDADILVIRRVAPYTLDTSKFSSTSSIYLYSLENIMIRVEAVFLRGIPYQKGPKGAFIHRSYKWNPPHIDKE